jgi:hypothetical protein
MSAKPNQGLATAPIKVRASLPAVAPEVMREAPEGKAWTVKPGRGSVNLNGAEMLVPMGADDAARHTRIHELLHARATPADLLVEAREQGASWEAVQGCEDGRLGTIAREQGIRAYTSTAPISEDDARRLFGTCLNQGEHAVPTGEPNYHRAAALAGHVGPCIGWPCKH